LATGSTVTNVKLKIDTYILYIFFIFDIICLSFNEYYNYV
jgi:hypothetical protein